MNDHVKDHSGEFSTWEAEQRARAKAFKASRAPAGARASEGDGIPVLKDVIRPGPDARATSAAEDGKAAARKPALATDPWPVSTLDDPTPARKAPGRAAPWPQSPSPGLTPVSDHRRARPTSAVNLDRLIEEAVQTALRAATPLIVDIVTEQLRAQLAEHLEKGPGAGEKKDPPSP